MITLASIGLVLLGAAEFGLNEAKLDQARDHALRLGGGSGVVLHHEKVVYRWGDQTALYDLKSTTKSIGATLLGLAIADRKLALQDPVAKLCPDSGVPDPKITFFHLATHTAGFDKPGGFQPLLFTPGTKWAYSDSGPNYLADCLTHLYQRDLAEVLFERVLTPLGVARETFRWRENAYRPKQLHGVPRREFGSGVHATVEVLARLGLLYNRAGRIKSRQVLPLPYVAMLRQPVKAIQGLPVLREADYPQASNHYGLLWWNNGDGSLPGVPRDAFWSWGLYDSHLIVIPSLDLIVARAGKSMDGGSGAKPSRLLPFLLPIVEAVDAARHQTKAPYPPSSVIEGIDWAPVESIHRYGSDCDNFPTAWAADGELYTAYGDCRGFPPLRPQKLGMGFAKLAGPPESVIGTNIVSDTADNTGQGAHGRKASGMLSLGGVLYLWVRNAGNSQLAWSTDQARTWTWADWKFTTSFGHPAFLSFGQDGKASRDEYVYLYSPDHDTAYQASASLVMARVPKKRIHERDAYEFFVKLDAKGRPLWTKDIAQRGPVFLNPPGGVYRTQVSYNAGLKRYLMNQILIGSDHVRFQCGFGVYDAPEPWGPWTTAYFTTMWDVGPGENQHFPPKWMSADGRTLYLLFSGDDILSTRKATLRLRGK